MARTKHKKSSSHQPPLPRGLPPRPSAPSSSYGADTYRPADPHYESPPPSMYHFRGAASRPSSGMRSPPQDNYRPGPSNSYHSSYDAPPGYGSSGRAQSFRHSLDDAPGHGSSNSYRPSYDAPGAGPPSGNSYRPSYDDGFNFRYEPPPGLDHRQADMYRPRSRSPPRLREFSQGNNGAYRQHQNSNNQYGGPRGGYRGRGGPRMASDRAFLKTNRAPTPELMPGMDDDQGTGVRYKPVNDISDSEEAEMDLSNSDEEPQQPKKKQLRTESKAADGDSVPRWSNPDPYTALPPPDESQRKKKDVVKLIRKARVIVSSENTTKTDAVTDDFISFDFDDDQIGFQDDKHAGKFGVGVEGAPTGPRSTTYHGNQQEPRSSLVNDNDVPAPGDRLVKGNQQIISNGQHKVTEVAEGNVQAQNRDDKVLQGNMNSFQPSLSSIPYKKSLPGELRSDSALGSRKRNIRDEIKPPPQIHEKVSNKPPGGKVFPSWQAIPGTSATPWISLDHSNSANMGVWLHKEIMDFYNFVKPRKFENVIRTRLIDDLRSKVRIRHPTADILPFGSFPAGLYLPTADMDLVCVSPQFLSQGRETFGRTNSWYWQFASALRGLNLPLNDECEVISKAKVPLVKYVDRITGLKVDISFENDTGLIANKTFQEWKTMFPAMPILVTLIKHLLAMRGLNEPFNGGIGGFSVTCLVVSLLQHMPQVQSGTMIPEHHLGEVLMEFLDLYGNRFDTKTTAIIMNPPSYISKASMNMTYKKPMGKFSIIDPNRSSNDIAGGSSNSAVIIQTFSNAYRDLERRMAELSHSDNRSCESILGCIIGGNYSSFSLQREHLAHVHEQLYGPMEE